MIQRLYSLFVFSVAFATIVKAQNVEFDKDNFPDNKEGVKAAIKEIKEGDKYYKLGPRAYKFALEHYLKAADFNSKNAELNFKVGDCYLHTIHKVRAIPYLESAYKLNRDIDPKIHYMLGDAYHLNLQWDEAIKEYTTYKNGLTPEELRIQTDDIKKKTEECNTGRELVKHPVKVFIDNIGGIVNSSYADYTPVISADESTMFFTSRRDNTTGGGKDENDFEYFEDIYITYKENGKWVSPENPGPPINTNENDASIGLSADGQKLFIYKGDNGGDIFECVLKGKYWSKPERMDKVINTKFHESAACYSFDQKTLYFVSDKPGGYGGRDIYMTKLNKKGKKWEEPVNMGAVINTPYDEEGVFMHPDGKTMYFSSRGHRTMGGYDIFRTLWNDTTQSWSEPENIGYPVNTADDDVFFVISASGKHGYYSSVKNNGIGDQDIYLITFLGAEKPMVLNTEDNLLASLAAPTSEKTIEPVIKSKTSQLTIFKGRVLDALTMQPVEATLEITDNQKNEIISSFESNATTGKYLVSLPSGKNYGIAVKADKYLFYSENFDIPASAGYQEVTKDILLKRIEVGSKIVLKNIFFDFDRATLRPESTAELERLTKLLNDNSGLKIEISGHTDNKGSATYNQKLSEDRAKTVVDYLIQHGISASRLQYKGYGLSQPIATNDTDEGRQLNRRTEFKIVAK